MKVWHFTEQPYYPVWDETTEHLKLTLPNQHANPKIVADMYDRYFDEWQLCDEIGINIMVNEHHSTATCLSPSCTLTLAALARLTKNVRLLSLGIPIANRPDPVRVAEEIAMIDCYSRGRFEMGFVKGIDYDLYPSNSAPVTQVRRFAEAYNLIVKALSTRDGPFSWQGEFFNYRHINVWPRTYQESLPPTWMVALGAAAGGWIAEQKATVGTFLTGRTSKFLFDAYRKKWNELGWGVPGLNKFGYMAIVAVADTEAEAKKRAHHIVGYLRTQNRYGSQFQNPIGYLPAEFAAKKMRIEATTGKPFEMSIKLSNGTDKNLYDASIDDLIDAQLVFAGTPDQVFEQIKAYNTYVGGIGNLILMAQGGDLSHADTVSSLSLFAREVMPRLGELSAETERSTQAQPEPV